MLLFRHNLLKNHTEILQIYHFNEQRLIEIHAFLFIETRVTTYSHNWCILNATLCLALRSSLYRAGDSDDELARKTTKVTPGVSKHSRSAWWWHHTGTSSLHTGYNMRERKFFISYNHHYAFKLLHVPLYLNLILTLHINCNFFPLNYMTNDYAVVIHTHI